MPSSSTPNQGPAPIANRLTAITVPGPRAPSAPAALHAPRARRDDRGGRPFVLEDEVRPAESDEERHEDPAVSAELPLGQAAPDEAGCRLDVSA